MRIISGELKGKILISPDNDMIRPTSDRGKEVIFDTLSSILCKQDKEYKEIEKQIKQDIDTGMALNPVDVTSFDMMDRQNDAFAPEIEAQSQEDQAAIDQKQADDDHKKEMQKMKAAPKPKAASSTK